MTSFFPDLNVWLALSVSGHVHSVAAWRWMNLLPRQTKLLFSRYTQVGLLRLLTNTPVMGQQVLTLNRAWHVYDTWLKDPRVMLHPEPRELDHAFRQATASFGGKPASNFVGDCYLLAYARSAGAALVTFDRPLARYAEKLKWQAIVPAP
jgi:uncharacterized protein